MSKVLKVTPKTLAIDIVLTIAAYIFFALWFAPHAPSENAGTQTLVGAFTALPAAGAFYFCLNMFKVVLAHQRERDAKAKK